MKTKNKFTTGQTYLTPIYEEDGSSENVFRIVLLAKIKKQPLWFCEIYHEHTNTLLGKLNVPTSFLEDLEVDLAKTFDSIKRLATVKCNQIDLNEPHEYSNQIFGILVQTNWYKIFKVMRYLKWTWHFKSSTPTVLDLIQETFDRLLDVAGTSGENHFTHSGGISIEKVDHMLIFSFEIERSSGDWGML